MAQVSKKGLTLAKLETWMGLQKDGYLPADRLAVAVKEGLDKGEIVPQTEEVYAEKSAELLEFAKSLDLVKVKSAPFGKKGKDYEDYIREQYPDTAQLFDAVKQLSSRSYDITLDSGEKATIQPLPFCRNITPKSEKVTAEAPSTEGAVSV